MHFTKRESVKLKEREKVVEGKEMEGFFEIDGLILFA